MAKKGKAKSVPKKEKKETQAEDKSVEEPKVENTQPISKPKTYKKTQQDKARIERSKSQRIFLLSAHRQSTQQYWQFRVLGTTGSQYDVYISPQTLQCTCFDYRMKKKPCKHIFFIVTQVAQNDQLLGYIKSNTSSVSKAAYEQVDKQLTERLKARLSSDKKDAKDIDLKGNTDCTICFTQMDKETEDLEGCGQCKNYFHVMCISAWKNHNPTCPLCRGSLLAGMGDGAFSRVHKITID